MHAASYIHLQFTQLFTVIACLHQNYGICDDKKRSHCTWLAPVTARQGVVHWPGILCLIALYGKHRREEREGVQESKSKITAWLHLGIGKKEEEDEQKEEEEENKDLFSQISSHANVSGSKTTIVDKND